MSTIPYTKQLISFEEQVDLLKDRGMSVENEDKAVHVLQNVSYYRLSGYWYPLLEDKENHVFKPGATFDTVFAIYKFDSKLRKLIITELEKIEVAVRTQIVHILSQRYDGYWFTNAALFTSPTKHAKALIKIAEEYNRSDEEFVTAFKNKYSNPFPPSWMTMEITSFGSLSILYSNLKPGKTKREIANYFGLPDTVLESWLHSIVYLRNICAHHCRLWNRVLSIRPLMPRSPKKQFIQDKTVSNKRTYFILCMVIYMLNTVNPKHSFIVRFKKLLAEYPNIDVKAMGFPVNWENDPLWQSDNN